MKFVINLFRKFEDHIKIIGIIGGAIIGAITIYKEIGNPFKKEKDIILDARLASYSDPEVQKIIPDTAYLTTYNQIPNDDTVVIQPNSEYTDQFFNKKFLSVPFVAEPGVPDFTVHFPILDVRVINNTAKTIVLNEIALNVKSSNVDMRPLLYLVTYSNQLFNFSIKNEGWGKWQSCTIKFNLGPEVDSTRNNEKYEYILRLPYFIGSQKINIEKYLVDKGINISFLKNAERHNVRPSKQNKSSFENALKGKSNVEASHSNITYFICMNGQLDIEPNNYKINFSAKIPLTIPEELGDALDIFDKYDIKLKDSASDYSIKYPISISLRPNEPERILLKLKADKSSFHIFKVGLNNINKMTIESDPIKLDLFLPRTSAQMFKK